MRWLCSFRNICDIWSRRIFLKTNLVFWSHLLEHNILCQNNRICCYAKLGYDKYVADKKIEYVTINFRPKKLSTRLKPKSRLTKWLWSPKRQSSWTSSFSRSRWALFFVTRINHRISLKAIFFILNEKSYWLFFCEERYGLL